MFLHFLILLGLLVWKIILLFNILLVLIFILKLLVLELMLAVRNVVLLFHLGCLLLLGGVVEDGGMGSILGLRRAGVDHALALVDRAPLSFGVLLLGFFLIIWAENWLLLLASNLLLLILVLHSL